jgi:hypothetical protein
MTDNEFTEAVQAIYAREIAQHGDKNRAHRKTEEFRRNLIVSFAAQAKAKLDK